jgi:lysozyme
MNFEALLSALKSDEGFREKPYSDTVGKLTIGYGRNLDDVGISRQEAHDMLTRDAIKAMRDAADLVPNWVLIDPIRQNVVANMAFNLGKTRLAKFVKFLAAVNARDYLKASAEMKDSIWYVQTGSRARRLVDEMRTGIVA